MFYYISNECLVNQKLYLYSISLIQRTTRHVHVEHCDNCLVKPNKCVPSVCHCQRASEMQYNKNKSLRFK